MDGMSGGMGGYSGGMYDPDHYIDYDLKQKSEPGKETSPSLAMKDINDGLKTLKDVKDSLAQESSGITK